MAGKRLPDLSPGALSRLVVGMTTDEVEAVIGRYRRPNLHQGRRHYAWMRPGGMLRAFFTDPTAPFRARCSMFPRSSGMLDLAGMPAIASRTARLFSGGPACHAASCTAVRLFPALVCPTCGWRAASARRGSRSESQSG